MLRPLITTRQQLFFSSRKTSTSTLTPLAMRLFSLCLLATTLAIASADDDACMAGAPDKRSCTRHVVIAIDETNYMASTEAVDAEIDFIYNYIIPELNVDYGLISIGFEVYGTGKLTIYDTDSDRTVICNNMQEIRGSVNMKNPGSESLVKTMTNLCNNFELDSTSFVLFSASTNQSDVNDAGTYLFNRIAKDGITGFSVVAVNYGNTTFYDQYWPSRYTQTYNRANISDIDLAGKIDDTICDPIYTAPPPTTTVAPKTTAAPITRPVITLAPSTPSTTTKAPTTTTTAKQTNAPLTRGTIPLITTPSSVYPPAPLDGGGISSCECNNNKIWLDVIALVDSSSGMGSKGLMEATNFIASVFAKATIGQAEQYQTRLGVVAFADDVKMIYDLDYFTSTMQMVTEMQIPYMNTRGTNIEGAIQMATKMFESKARISARQVIFLVSSDYASGSFDDPTQVATEFKNDNGVIITVSYEQIHGMDSSILSKLASPNYNLTNEDPNSVPDAQFLLCEANCFCPRNYAPYNPDKWNAPQGGCYTPVTIPSFQMLAQRHCDKFRSSIVSIVESPQKAQFLASIHDSAYAQWIGLTFQNGQWLWPKGYSVGYANWAPGANTSGQGNQTCAYMITGNAGLQWMTDDCFDDFNFVCQSSPCDSTHYCNYYDE